MTCGLAWRVLFGMCSVCEASGRPHGGVEDKKEERGGGVRSMGGSRIAAVLRFLFKGLE